jgi:hypothetical protein
MRDVRMIGRLGGPLHLPAGRALVAVLACAACGSGGENAGGTPTTKAPSDAKLQVDCDFPGGNIVVEKIEGDSVRVRCDPRDSAWNLYWSFRVRGATGRELTVELVRGGFTPMGPAVSMDRGKTWRWLGQGAVTKNAFKYPVQAGVDEVRFCASIPYTQANLNAFLERHRGHAHIRREVLCKTRGGREADVLYAGRLDGNAPHAVAFTCRHHACEVTASYVLEGVLEAVLADSDAGPWLRQNVEFLIVPFVDADGVEAGDQGKSRRPHDHCRDYEGQPIYPTVRAIKELLPKWSRGRLRLVLDLHCPTIGERKIYFVEGMREQANVRIRRLASLIEQVRKGPLPFNSKDNLPFGTQWNTDRSMVHFENWAATLPSAPAVAIIEVAYSTAGAVPMTEENLRTFGADMAAGIAAFLREGPPAGAGPKRDPAGDKSGP